MTNEPDLIGWETAATAEESDYDADEAGSLSNVGDSALSRLCAALGVRSCYNIISTEIAPFLSSGQWKYELAGLRCLASFLEISSKISDTRLLDLHRKEVVATLRLFAKNANPRVRAAAFISVSQFFLYHRNDINPELHVDPLLQTVAEGVALSENVSPRVRRHAMMALINIIDHSSYEYLEVRAPKLLNLLAKCLGEGPQLVQEQCLSAITSMVESLRGSAIWAACYNDLIPVLKQLLNNLNSLVSPHSESNHGDFWLKILECCTILGDAAGRNYFNRDCGEIMQMLISFQRSQNVVDSLDNVMDIAVLKIWVQIARCLGTEALPYLRPVVESLLQLMGKDVTVPAEKLQDYENGNNDDEDDNESDIQMLETADGGWVAVRSSAIEEQAAACKLVLLLIEALQEHMFEYIEKLHNTISQLILSPHEDVRSYSIVLIPELLRCVGKAAACHQLTSNDIAVVRTDKVQEYFPLCLKILIGAVEVESTLELIMTGLQAIRQTVIFVCTNWLNIVLTERNAIGSGSASRTQFQSTAPTKDSSLRLVTYQQMVDISECAKVVLRDSFQRRAVLRAEAQVSGQRDDDDADDEQAFMEDSMELHNNVAELIGTLFKTHGKGLFPMYMNLWHEIIHNACQPFCLKEDQQFAFYVISDVIEHGLKDAGDNSDGDANRFYSLVMDNLINACGVTQSAKERQVDSIDKELAIKRVCAYSIGIAAGLFPAAFAPYVNAALKGLWICVTSGDEEGPGSRGATTDNAVSAVGTILEAAESLNSQIQTTNDSSTSFQFIWGEWLLYLPLKEDLEEGEKVILQLIRLVGKKHKAIVGQRDRLLMTISILLTVFDTDDYWPGGKQSPMNTQCTDCLLHLLQSVSPDLNIEGNVDRQGSLVTSPIAVRSLTQWLPAALGSKLKALLQETQSQPINFRNTAHTVHSGLFEGSPLATAPILDVLMRK